MAVILNKNLIKYFYEDSIKNRKTNKENLISHVGTDFKKILKKVSAKKNYKALDLGYGYGNYSIELAKSGFKVTAIDYISKNILKNRIKKLKISNKIRIIEQDLNLFTPKEKYNFVVAKDILHFLPKQKTKSLLKKLTTLTEKGGWHYLIIFTDIKREFINGEKIKIKNEANLTKNYLFDLINTLYKNWKLRIKVENYKEFSHTDLGRNFNFYAKKVIIIANKI